MCAIQALQGEALGTTFEGRTSAAEDALDIADNQSGRPLKRREFDWTGSTNYMRMHREVIPADASASIERFGNLRSIAWII